MHGFLMRCAAGVTIPRMDGLDRAGTNVPIGGGQVRCLTSCLVPYAPVLSPPDLAARYRPRGNCVDVPCVASGVGAVDARAIQH